MRRPRVLTTVIDPGKCRHYQKDRTFVLGGFTPKGVCDSAYAALSRDAQALRYGGTLPWQKDGRVLTRCPDPEGALWELRLDDSHEESQTGEASTFRVEVCRAKERGCRSALTVLTPLQEATIEAIRESGWDEYLRRRVGGKPLAHQQLRVALAACPNCCTQPQIKDLGIVAGLSPKGIASSCTGCGKCAQVCQESAIAVAEEQATFDRQICVSCGLCVRECQADAIETDGLRFHILVGGKLGRHPRFAEALPETVDTSQVSAVVRRLLRAVMDNMEDGERIGDVVQRIGLDAIARTMRDAQSVIRDH